MAAKYAKLSFFILFLVWVGFINVALTPANNFYQQPTVAIPTVTGTPKGPTVIVNSDRDQINVRSGPSTNYPQVGVLIAGQEVPALGRSPGGDWIQIAYTGVSSGVAWVYSFLVSSPTGSLPIVEPPPTPTPRITPTIDPTLIAEFNIVSTPTRLPTFTSPAPLVLPTLIPVTPNVRESIPPGMFIVALAVLGVFGALISLIRGR